MRVVHIGYLYGEKGTGGAAIAATRLHKALLSAGVDSHYICIHQREEGLNVHVLPLVGRVSRFIYLIATKLLRHAWRLFGYRKAVFTNLIPLIGLERELKKINPDVIHVHWIISDVISFGQLASFGKPTVMHLHDLFPVNILRPYPADDRRFIDGVNSTNSSFLERWLFLRKRKAILSANPFFVGPSEWICGIAKASIIGSGSEFHVIQNIIDKRICLDKNLRKEQEKFHILFGAYGGRANPLKGWLDLEESLTYLPMDIRGRIVIDVFGEAAQDYDVCGVCVHFCGAIQSAEEMKKVYHAADVYALPSKEDNAPSTKFEALLCGLPVLAFRRTGCAEGIEHGVSGWLSDDGDLFDYAEGIMYYFKQWNEKLIRHDRIAALAASSFQEQAIVNRFVSMYREVANAY